MNISNLSVMILLNASQKDLLVEQKIISSIYIWHTNKSVPILRVKSVESPLPILRPLSIRKFLSHSYHALGACLSHIAPYVVYKHGYDTLHFRSQVVTPHTPLL
jgi:hypothetical protein